MKKLMILGLLSLASCSSLNSIQKHEYKEWKAAGLAQETKSEGLAAGLNVLPGIGDFYNGNVGLGVVNLLTWPLSVLWAPVGGATGAQEHNYFETKTVVDRYEKNKQESINMLNLAATSKQITQEQYLFISHKFNSMPLTEFKKTRMYNEFLQPFPVDRLPASSHK